MGYFLTIYAAVSDIGPPPSIEDAARPASMAPYLIGCAGAWGIFLAGLILGAFITYIVVKKGE